MFTKGLPLKAMGLNTSPRAQRKMARSNLHLPTRVWASDAVSELSCFPHRRGATKYARPLAIAAAGLGVLAAFGADVRLQATSCAMLLSAAYWYALPQIRGQRWCKTALASMWQGAVLYDADGRLLLYNSQFCRMLGLAPAEVGRAATHRDIVRLSVTAGNHGDSCAEQVGREDAIFIARRQSALAYINLADGRTIAESHQPVAGGGWIRTYADVTGRRQAEDRIIHMARHDALTDLPNRVLFHERLEQALEGASETASVAVMFLDLDRFKAVNDTLGHAAGDLLLKHVASRLRGAVRDSDTVARLGGDEFAVVQIGVADASEADELARRLIAVVSDPYDVDAVRVDVGASVRVDVGASVRVDVGASVRVDVGASVGITLAPADGALADELLKHADMALYEAKSAGRGIHRFYVSEMNAQITRRRALEADLREALQANQFDVHYQPLINLRTFRVEAFEALLRWQHPTRGMIAPCDFMPIAEEIGLIVEIGAWALREACRTAAHWPDGVGVAVNMSPAQLRGEQIVATVADALTRAGLRADSLELELTESVLLQHDDQTLSALHRLIELGVRMAMDDFGTGYSSLSSLSRFPFQTIKIDRSFTERVADTPGARAIVRAVSQLGRSLGMNVTAEGVETPEQLARIVAEDCTTGQGYLFGGPMPGASVAGFLDQWPAQSASLTRRAAGQSVCSSRDDAAVAQPVSA